MKNSYVIRHGLGVKVAVWSAIVIAGACSHDARADLAYAWGANDQGQLGNGSSSLPYGNYSSPAPVVGLSANVSGVFAGAISSYSIQNGAGYAWGNDAAGQLGILSFAIKQVTPTPISGLSTAPPRLPGEIHMDWPFKTAGCFPGEKASMAKPATDLQPHFRCCTASQTCPAV